MVKMTCFRFNLDNPEHARAWKYIHDVDKKKMKSGNTAVIKAINEYFDRMQKLTDDPYFETRQREERFVEQIVSEVGKALTAEMPKFLASLMLSLNTSYPAYQPVQAVSADADNVMNTDENGENDDYSDIDMDFIGG